MDVRIHRAEGQQDVQIVDIEGNIATDTAPEVEKALNTLIEANAVKIIVDFAKVDYISSAGLRVFLGAAKRVRAKNGDLKLVNLISNVENVFKLVGFTKILTIMSDIESALNDF